MSFAHGIVQATAQGWRLPAEAFQGHELAIYRLTGRLLYELDGESSVHGRLLRLHRRAEQPLKNRRVAAETDRADGGMAGGM